jgi:CBS domain-containing protein
MSTAIASIMHRIVYPVSMDDSVADVEALLQSHRISSVPVYDSNGTVIGIITNQDLVRFHAAGKDPRSMHAWEICTYRPLEVPPDMPLEQVAKLMLERNVHHVVVAEDGAMKGIVSALDFVRLFADPEHGTARA